jgi:hypothetical protein
MPSRTSRSTARASRPPPPPGSVDVYLMPSVVGGGAGDVDEVLCAGRALARAGFALTVYRRAGVPLPAGVAGPWAWPPHRRTSVLRPRNARALLVAPAWGVTCAPSREGPYGRPGPWAREAAEVEKAYGTAQTAHVSLEEFGRTLGSRAENLERFREGGVRSRALGARLAQARASGEVETFVRAYRAFRAFDRPNVLHLYAAFRYEPRFAREFPEAVQSGPLWPGGRPALPSGAPRDPGWVWYASPASAETIAPQVIAGLARVPGRPRLLIRTPRPWRSIAPGPSVSILPRPMPARVWTRTFRSAAVRIATGSRSLLEALEDGGPFLYFNGVLGSGRARRRHRPEKIVGLLAVARSDRWPSDLVRDLGDFSRGHRVQEVVRRAAERRGGWASFPPRPRPCGFAPGFEDAGSVLVRFAREFGEGRRSAQDVVAATRRQSHR